MKRIILASLIGLATLVGFALFPREYARVSSPDGRHVAVAKYRAYQAWRPASPGDAGGKEGWISIVTKDGEKIGDASVDRVSRIQDVRWTPDSVELYMIFAMALADFPSEPAPGPASVARNEFGPVRVVVEHIQPDGNAPSVRVGEGFGRTHASETHRIPLIRGHAFSVVFSFDASHRSIDEVRLKVNHPAMEPPGLPRRPGPIDRLEQPAPDYGRRIVAFLYVFDEEWELVPGQWHFEIWHGSRKLSETDAETYWPEPIRGKS